MKKHARKYVAAALAVAGVAGLSLAAAATLNVETSKEIAIGSGTFAPCDTDGVKVSYDYTTSGTDFIIENVTVSDIAAECAGEAIAVSLTDADGSQLATATGTVAGTSFEYDVSGDAIDIALDLGEATVIISG